MGIIIKAPDGSNSVTIQQSTNVTTTVEASDIASDSYFKARTGTSGNVNFRNKLVDGRFDFWYEGATQSTVNGSYLGAGLGYRSDTMYSLYSNFYYTSGSPGYYTYYTSVTNSKQLLSSTDLPAIEVPTATNYCRIATSVTTLSPGASVLKTTKIESARTLSGKTATLSFYAKADAVKYIGASLTQYFGSGGSSSIGVAMQSVSVNTSWARYSMQFTIPSISPSTVFGTGDSLDLNLIFDSSNFPTGNQTGTFDIACIQLEEGTIATPFEELPPEIALSRVNRYYQFIPMNTYKPMLCSSTTTGYMMVDFFSPMRATPSLVLATPTVWINGTTLTVTASSTNSASISSALINITVASGLTNLALAMVSGAGLKADARL